MPGTLFVVATPIGNLEDITLRALRVLREADVIAAEDTRRTGKLLAHYEIGRPMVSLREHNEAAESARLLRRLALGESVALVSDAGTPAISDPGARFVSAAREAGVPVVPIPGPSAVMAALSVSGLDAGSFAFLGFPPATGSARAAWFERLTHEPAVVVFFESPHRIIRTLKDGSKYWLNRQILVFRELTKVNEELVVSPNNERGVRERGELTIVLGPSPATTKEETINEDRLYEMFCGLTQGPILDRDEALEMIALVSGVSLQACAKIVKKRKILADRQNRPSP